MSPFKVMRSSLEMVLLYMMSFQLSNIFRSCNGVIGWALNKFIEYLERHFIPNQF
jgi:hypothetical protein